MTTDTNTPADVYDPDAPPESQFITEFIGTLVTSVMVTPDNLSTMDPQIVKSATDYWGDRKPGPIWFLEAHGISVQRTDGKPFRQSDIIALTGKDGKWLGKGMAPDSVAKQYVGHGVTASYLRVGQPNSAVGRVFRFKEQDIKLGKKFSKKVSLFPVELKPVGYQYDGEVTMVEPSSNDEEGTAPATAPTVSPEQVTSLLREALTGKTKSEMFEAIIGDDRLKTVGKVFGVGLMEAATDESLAGVLAENGVLVEGPDGKLIIPPSS